MLSSKKSPRKSEVFRSRFLAAGKDASIILDVRRLREFLAGQAILAVLQLGFVVALLLFGRALYTIFERHGDALNPLYLRLSLGGTLVCFLLVCRRFMMRIREIIFLRRDLKEANSRLRELREHLRSGDDHPSIQ